MTDLTPLDEKLGEVPGLAQAAQTVTETVSKMDGAGAFRDELESMSRQAEETERRTDALVDGLEGRKTAIREKARETKSEAGEMMKSYLGRGGGGAGRLRVPEHVRGGRAVSLGDRR